MDPIRAGDVRSAAGRKRRTLHHGALFGSSGGCAGELSGLPVVLDVLSEACTVLFTCEPLLEGGAEHREVVVRQVVVVVDQLAGVSVGLHGLAQRIGCFDLVVLEWGDQSSISGDELLACLIFGEPVQEVLGGLALFVGGVVGGVDEEVLGAAADSPEAVQGRLLIQDIMDFWLGLGADGFRVDMAGSLVKEDPDHYWTKLLWQQVRAHLDETYPEAVLVSEWGDPEEALHAGFDMDFLLHFGPSHYLDLFRENPYFSAGSSEATGSAETAETEHDGERSECDGAGSSGCDSNGNSVVDGDNPNCNNDNVGNASGDIKAFADTYTAMLASTAGTPGYICIPSGNHDMIRMRDTLTTDEMKLAFTFLLTMPGCPFIYYGDEIGMRYMHGLKSKEGGYERTGSRTPMQWSCATNAGFSAARPDDLYLPIDADSERPNVASQTGRSDSLLETVRALNTLRLAHPALQADGGIEFLYAEDHAYPLVYARSSEAGEAERDATDGERSGTAHETSCETPCETCSKINREAGGERIVVAINPSNTDASCTLPSDYVKLLSGGLAQEISQEPAEKTVLLSIGNPARFDGTQLHVPARSATILPC